MLRKELNANTSASVLAVRSIQSAYNQASDHLVLQDVTLDLRPGELVVVIGPNGSGKSTLIRALCRTLRPKAGVVLLDDLDLYLATSARKAARRIGVVPQETTIAFEFNVREVVAMGRAPHQPAFSFGVSETDRDIAAIDEAMRRADVPLEFESRPISTLSGGERQRVLVARALAQEAEVLLLDEPTAALDLRHENEIMAWLSRLVREEKRIVLAALHDLNLAAQYADRIVVLCAGRIAAMGTPDEALTEEIIAQVYGVNVLARRHPLTGRPYFLTVPGPLQDT